MLRATLSNRSKSAYSVQISPALVAAPRSPVRPVSGPKADPSTHYDVGRTGLNYSSTHRLDGGAGLSIHQLEALVNDVEKHTSVEKPVEIIAGYSRHVSLETDSPTNSALVSSLRCMKSLHAIGGAPQLSSSRQALYRYSMTGRRELARKANDHRKGSPLLELLPTSHARPSQVIDTSSSDGASRSEPRSAPVFHSLIEAIAEHPSLKSMPPDLLIAAAEVVAVDCQAPWHQHVFTLLSAAIGAPLVGAIDQIPAAVKDAVLSHPRLVATLLRHYSRLDVADSKLPASEELLAQVCTVLSSVYRVFSEAVDAGFAPSLTLPGVLDDGAPQLHSLARRLSVAVSRQLLSRLQARAGPSSPTGDIGGSGEPGPTQPELALNHAVALLSALALLPRAVTEDTMRLRQDRTHPRSAPAFRGGATDEHELVIEDTVTVALIRRVIIDLKESGVEGEDPMMLLSLLRSAGDLVDLASAQEARIVCNELHAAVKGGNSAAGGKDGAGKSASKEAHAPLTVASMQLLHSIVSHMREPTSLAGLPVTALVTLLAEMPRHLSRSWHVPGDLAAATALEKALLSRNQAEWASVPSCRGLVQLLSRYAETKAGSSERYADVVCAAAMLLLRRGGVSPYAGKASSGDAAAWFAGAVWDDADIAQLARACLILHYRIGSAAAGGPSAIGAVNSWAAGSNGKGDVSKLQLGEPAAGARLAAAGAPRPLQALCFLADAADAASSALVARCASPARMPTAHADISHVALLTTWATLAAPKPGAAAALSEAALPVSRSVMRTIASTVVQRYLRDRCSRPAIGSLSYPVKPAVAALAPAVVALTGPSAGKASGPFSRALSLPELPEPIDAGSLSGSRHRIMPRTSWLAQPVKLHPHSPQDGGAPPVAVGDLAGEIISDSTSVTDEPRSAWPEPPRNGYLLHVRDRAAVARYACSMLDAASALLKQHEHELAGEPGSACALLPEQTSSSASGLGDQPRWVTLYNEWISSLNRNVHTGLRWQDMATPPAGGASTARKRPSQASKSAAGGVAPLAAGATIPRPFSGISKLCFDVDARGTEARLMKLIAAAQGHNQRVAEAALAAAAADASASPSPLGNSSDRITAGWTLSLPSRQVARLVETWADWQPCMVANT